MKRKRFGLLIAILLALSLVLAACANEEPVETVEPEAAGEVEEEVAEEEPEVAEEEPEAVAEVPEEEPAAQAGSRLQTVRDRGRLICGINTDLPGFGFIDADGRNAGFDVDLCRAVAAGIFGDPEAVEFIPLTAEERGPALQTGEVDMLARNTTWTSSRDAQWGNFTTIMFFDGQGFMVPADSGIETLEELDGATVCVISGTTTELNLADAFRQRGLEFTPTTFADTPTVYSTYESGGCDATTSDKSQLASVRSGFEDPSAHRVLDITISKEPLTPAVPAGDDQWADVVDFVLWSLINAEELGVTQGNVAEMVNSDNIQIRRMLGSEGEFGQAEVGLDPDFAVDVISAVGNYGEIYDRWLGPDALDVPRGPNQLWSEGGLIYAPPLR